MRPLARALRSLLCSIGFVLLLCGHAAAGARVVLVTGEREGPHEEMLQAVLGALAPELGTADLDVRDPQSYDSAQLSGTRIVVTIGTQAAKAVSARRTTLPVLHTLLPRETFEGLTAGRTLPNQSAIFLDQPESRQIALITTALPEKNTLALLGGPGSDQRLRRLSGAARTQHLSVSTEQVGHEREIYPALERLLQGAPILVALPDSTVFNSYTIQNILLTSYRNRAPLIGFSPAYVRAGALLALYSTPAQLGRQTAAAVRSVLAGDPLPPPQGPREFEVASNPVVARALGIALEAPERIAERMRGRETTREVRP